MKSIFATAFLVLAAAACNKTTPVDTTSTTSAETPPPADTNGTTPPPAVPELGKDAPAAKRATSAKPQATSTGTDDGVTSTSGDLPADDAAPATTPTTAVPPTVQGTTTTTTVTTTTVKKKPVEKQGNGYGTGAARGNGINSSDPVGNGGGGVR